MVHGVVVAVNDQSSVDEVVDGLLVEPFHGGLLGGVVHVGVTDGDVENPCGVVPEILEEALLGGFQFHFVHSLYLCEGRESVA